MFTLGGAASAPTRSVSINTIVAAPPLGTRKPLPEATMAGHSKWANIQHRKGAQDKKRAKVFSKCAKAIISAVRESGPDPDQNLKLKYAIEKARSVNMPRDNIERAIKSAVGSGSKDDYREVVYEGYGPGGVAIMIESLTDNRNRTAPELRKIFEKAGGNMGATGCVAHQFARKAQFLIPLDQVDEDRIMELSLEWGADDVEASDDVWEITGSPEAFMAIRSGIEAAELETRLAGVAQIPTVTVQVDNEKQAARILALMEALDDHDDVNNVYSNFDIDPDILEKVAGG